MKQIATWRVVLLGLAVYLAFSGPGGCTIVGGQVTQVTYVYEKDLHQVPNPVLGHLNTLNRRTPPVLSTTFEVDTKDGSQEVPDQYKVAVDAAKELPSLVVQAGQKVTKVVKDPKTDEDMKAAVP